MRKPRSIFKDAFSGPDDEASGRGVRPVIFDILGPDKETSLLPDGVKLVLHVNPKTMAVKYQRKVERIQTRGGFVEQHWGDDTQSISFENATGAFMRLYSGLSNVTNPAYGGTRQETLAYDAYLDMLAMFHNNASIYDSFGRVALQGYIKITFDGGVFLGWFDTFTVTENADQPYQFAFTMEFTVAKEVQIWRTPFSPTPGV